MPPVEVPAIRSKRLETSSPVRFSISVNSTAGITPRIPPPSIESILYKAIWISYDRNDSSLGSLSAMASFRARIPNGGVYSGLWNILSLATLFCLVLFQKFFKRLPEFLVSFAVFPGVEQQPPTLYVAFVGFVP